MKIRRCLQPVPEFLVLAVRHVSELNVLEMAENTLVSHVVTSLVLPHVVTSQNEGQHCSECASDDDSNFGWDVIWCTLLGEGERSDNVTKAKRDYSKSVTRQQ